MIGTIGAAGPAHQIRGLVSMQSVSGIWQSMSTTSSGCEFHASTAASPLGHDGSFAAPPCQHLLRQQLVHKPTAVLLDTNFSSLQFLERSFNQGRPETGIRRDAARAFFLFPRTAAANMGDHPNRSGACVQPRPE
jgi:hypothetical protein